MGFIHGVDGDAADENLLSGLQSAVRVLSASREGRTVTLRFEGPVPPDHVTLFRRPVSPRRVGLSASPLCELRGALIVLTHQTVLAGRSRDEWLPSWPLRPQPSPDEQSRQL
ncbi:hypothetical protein MRX96_047686 [Rhipicephalus microplus]